MAAHTGEKPLVCQTCGAGFVYPEHLKKHMRIHTGEKPFACRSCGRTFASKENRNVHEFIHTDLKPYQCAICDQGFMRKPLLIAHVTSVHHVEARESHIIRNSIKEDSLKGLKIKQKTGGRTQPIVNKGVTGIQETSQAQLLVPPAAHSSSMPVPQIQVQGMSLDMSVHGQYQTVELSKAIAGHPSAGKFHYVLQGTPLTIDQSKKLGNSLVIPGTSAVIMQGAGNPQGQFIQVELPKGYTFASAPTEYTT